MSDANAQWYYTVGSEQKGPVGVDQIRAMVSSGSLGPDTLVWTSTMTEWQPLGRTPLAAMAQPGGYATPAAAAPYAPAAPYGAAPYGGASYGYTPAPSPGFVDAIKICFSKYVTFAGRASRPEFWWFYLFYMIVLVVATGIDGVIIANGSGLAFLSTIAVLALFLPQISVTVRRLHDTDRSGWFYWIALIPLVGIILLIVWLCQPGTPTQNRFG